MEAQRRLNPDGEYQKTKGHDRVEAVQSVNQGESAKGRLDDYTGVVSVSGRAATRGIYPSYKKPTIPRIFAVGGYLEGDKPGGESGVSPLAGTRQATPTDQRRKSCTPKRDSTKFVV